MADAAIVIESTLSKIVDGFVVKVVFSTTSKSSLDGLGYRLRRANKAKQHWMKSG